MNRNASRAAVVLALLLAGVITTKAQRDYRDQSLDLIRFLATKPWAGRGHNRWDRAQRFDADMTDRFGAVGRWAVKPKPVQDDDSRNYIDDDDLKMETSITDEDLNAETPVNWGVSSKRSAVATALNGRRRRQPTPALGKAVTPYVGVGVLSNVDTFFDSLRDNLENLASLSPQQRATLFTDAPAVVRPPSSGGGGSVGGPGMRRLHALRPLRPTGNIRCDCRDNLCFVGRGKIFKKIPNCNDVQTYNRRSFVEPDTVYPGANHHDPGLLWTGLGR